MFEIDESSPCDSIVLSRGNDRIHCLFVNFQWSIGVFHSRSYPLFPEDPSSHCSVATNMWMMADTYKRYFCDK